MCFDFVQSRVSLDSDPSGLSGAHASGSLSDISLISGLLLISQRKQKSDYQSISAQSSGWVTEVGP